MPLITVEYRDAPGTRAAIGRAGNHIVIADRPDGKAGGMGLGFNGAQLLALALGGCFCNDIQYTADEMGETVSDLQVSVSRDLAGDPLIVKAAKMTVACTLADGRDPSRLIERATARCTVANSLRAGLDVSIG